MHPLYSYKTGVFGPLLNVSANADGVLLLSFADPERLRGRRLTLIVPGLTSATSVELKSDEEPILDGFASPRGSWYLARTQSRVFWFDVRGRVVQSVPSPGQKELEDNVGTRSWRVAGLGPSEAAYLVSAETDSSYERDCNAWKVRTFIQRTRNGSWQENEFAVGKRAHVYFEGMLENRFIFFTLPCEGSSDLPEILLMEPLAGRRVSFKVRTDYWPMPPPAKTFTGDVLLFPSLRGTGKVECASAQQGYDLKVTSLSAREAGMLHKSDFEVRVPRQLCGPWLFIDMVPLRSEGKTSHLALCGLPIPGSSGKAVLGHGLNGWPDWEIRSRSNALYCFRDELDGDSADDLLVLGSPQPETGKSVEWTVEAYSGRSLAASKQAH
jgi:hypothetical protein